LETFEVLRRISRWIEETLIDHRVVSLSLSLERLSRLERGRNLLPGAVGRLREDYIVRDVLNASILMHESNRLSVVL
jgi:hypothetical protein